MPRCHWATNLFLLGALLGSAVAQTEVPAPPTPTGESAPAVTGPEVLPVGVVLNGVAQGDTVILRQDGRYYATVDDVQRWHLRLSAQDGPRLEFEAQTYVALDALGSVPPRFDEQALTLTLEVPVSRFDESVLALTTSRTDPAPRGYAAALNYSVGAVAGLPDTASGGAAADVTVSTPFGVGRADASAALDAAGLRVVRGQTTWTYDIRNLPATLRVGDSAMQGGTWGVSVPYVGVQVATNFGLWPDASTVPLLTVEGQSPVAGTAVVYVDNRLLLTQDIPVGPFRITGLPAGAASGVIHVVVRGQDGTQTEILRPFVSDPGLLRPGLAAFAVEGGWRRESFDDLGFTYGQPLVSGLYRRGLTDTLTAEVRVEGDPQTYAVGGAVVYAWAGVGSVRAVAVGSGGAAGPGAMGTVSISGSRSRWLYGAALSGHTPGFRQVGVPGQQNPVQGSLSLSRDLGRYGTVSAAVNAARNPAGLTDASVSGSYGVTVQGVNMATSVTRQFGTQAGTRVAFSIGLPVAPDTLLSASTDLSGIQVGVNRTATAQRFGYSASAGYAGGQAAAQGQTVFLTPYGTAVAGLSVSAGSSNVGAQVYGQFSGGLGLVAGQVAAGPRVTDAFAVVRVGFPGVRVLVNGTVVGRTNSAGTVLVPSLNPYAKNTVSIDARDLPLNAQVGTPEQTVVPSGGSGTVIVFTPRIQRAALLRLALPDGTPVPAGSVARVDNDPTEYPVIEGGETYVENLAPTSLIRASWPEGNCQAHLTYPETQEPFVDLGVVKCE